MKEALDKILQFLRDKPFALLLVASLLIIVVSVIDFSDARNWNVQPATSFHHVPLIIGGILLLFAIATLFAGQKAATPFYNLSGEWSYQVRTVDGDLSHSGHCTMTQDSITLGLDGYRTRARKLVGGTVVESDVYVHWYSVWGQICGDKKVRFEYYIDLPMSKVGAVCRLDVSGDAKTMAGDYYLLPPFSDDTLNATHGGITFTRRAG